MSKNLGQPPCCNTGVQSTYKKHLRALIDWVQVTFFNFKSPYEIIEVLGLEENEFKDGLGLYSYSKSLISDGIQILYDGREDMGIHLQITGQGCRYYEEKNIKVWSKLFAEFLSYDAKFSRLDLAIDDFKPYFKIPTVVNKIKKGELVSRFKTAIRIEKINVLDGSNKGNTVYFGSPQSLIQIRMYEKKEEREEKGYKIEEGLESWNRTEIQLRNERANIAANLIAGYFLNSSKEDFDEEIGKFISGILANYLRFVNKSNDENKSRWPVSNFWKEFIGDVEKLRLTEVAPDKTIEDIRNWVEKQVATSLAVLETAYDIEMIKNIIEEGRKRITNKHVNMLLRFAETKNPPHEKSEG